MKIDQIREEIEELKRKHNAVILAHNYQIPEIQDLGDFAGDSLELSRKAALTDAAVIIFCGVDFMAETAKILSPDKKVILPVSDATCPMAEMITPEELAEFKAEHPGAAVVTYVNSTAAVKALSDICCTSSNAVRIVNSLEEDEVIFTPDRNLARFVSLHTSKKIIPWEGFCPVHQGIRVEDVQEAKKKYPSALFMAHPECRPEVQDMADYVVSTGQMFDVASDEDSGSFIVGTETGIIYPLSKKFPNKKFYPLKESAVCPNMKKTGLEDLLNSLRSLSPEVNVPSDIAQKAASSLRRMLEVG